MQFYAAKHMVTCRSCSKTHCSKSSFFSKKFNFDFPRKLWFFWVKNSWKFCGFGLFNRWQLWIHEENCQNNLGKKTCENVGVMSKWNFWTKIWLFEKCVDSLFYFDWLSICQIILGWFRRLRPPPSKDKSCSCNIRCNDVIENSIQTVARSIQKYKRKRSRWSG